MSRHTRFAMFAFGISISICTELATAGEPNLKHFRLDGDKITFVFGAIDDDMVVLDAHPKLKVIVIGGGGSWDGVLPENVPFEITDTGFAHIANCKELEQLLVSDHPVQVTNGT